MAKQTHDAGGRLRVTFQLGEELIAGETPRQSFGLEIGGEALDRCRDSVGDPMDDSEATSSSLSLAA